jgi:hypothetical protein
MSGPETAPTGLQDVFCTLTNFVPLLFPAHPATTQINRFDAAIALVTDTSLISKGTIFGIPNYTPTILTAVPGMRVIKSGRTSGVTRGIVTATRVNGVQVNYGTQASPLIATFNDWKADRSAVRRRRTDNDRLRYRRRVPAVPGLSGVDWITPG